MRADGPVRCGTCGQRVPLPVVAVRICYVCKRQIIRHDKWVFDKSRIRHRHCDNPDDYFPPDVRREYARLHALGRESEASHVLRKAQGKIRGVAEE